MKKRMPMKMVDKKQKQEEQRQQRKLERRSKNLENIERKAPKLTEKPTILIVSEGENTEPSYFKFFKLKSAHIEAIGEGYNTLSLVKRADEISKEKNYDQVWCVFDKDDFNNQDFNNAITKAKELKFGVAYSNQAFEYWFILHFNDHNGSSIHRNSYNGMINTYLKPLGSFYDGNGSKIVTQDFFNKMRSFDPTYKKNRTDLAIERAIRNNKVHKDSNTSYAKSESSTTVYELVLEILKHI